MRASLQNDEKAPELFRGLIAKILQIYLFLHKLMKQELHYRVAVREIHR